LAEQGDDQVAGVGQHLFGLFAGDLPAEQTAFMADS
jgi:hypothetical protein